MIFIILMIPLLFFFIIVTAQKHTKIYNEYWNDIGNTNYYFYDDRTFGKDIYDIGMKECEIIKDNTKYRNFINSKMECVGEWCVELLDQNNNVFSCSGTKDCYHVEHIIDKKNPEYEDEECVMIAGNLVMAYSRWNSGLGGMSRYNYTNSEQEKTEVYGKDNMNKIRNIIEKCNSKCVNKYIQDNSNNDNTNSYFDTESKIVIGGLCSSSVIFYIINNRYKKKKTNIIQNNSNDINEILIET